MHRPHRLNLTVPNKLAKRVIAPYVKVIRKKYMAPAVPESKSFKKHLERKPSLLFRDLSSLLSDNVDLPSLLHESSDVLKIATHAQGVSLYIVDTATAEIYQSQRYFDIAEPRIRWKVEEGTTVAAYVASKKQSVMIEDILQDERFPMGIGQKDQLTKSVLCVPVVTPDGEVYGVIELFRDTSQDHFEDKDLKIATLVTEWMAVAIYQNLKRVDVHKKHELNEYLLSLTKVFLEECVPTNKMISEMVKFVKLTLAAEKSSFYFLQKETEELTADVYEKRRDESDIHIKHNVKLVGKEKDIVASVAKTGITVNIRDAFTDPKIGKEIDETTGFIVRSVLCIAVKGGGDILGVIEVMNKSHGCFTKSDEILFEVFSTYFALVLQFNDLYERANRQEKINAVKQSLTQRQMGPCIHDYNRFMTNLNLKLPTNFIEFRWYIAEELVDEIPLFFYAMIKEFSDPDIEIDVGNLGRFVMAIRKFARKVPFFNFQHAFDFSHTVYCILKRHPEMFTPLECQMLLITGIGHCVDRHSTTNEYLVLTNHEIYQIWPKISWQNYHSMITGFMLQQFPIYSNMPPDAYKKFVQNVKDLIIKCDVKMSFCAKSIRPLTEIMRTHSFDNKDPVHHELLVSFILCCGDIGYYAKTYLVARKLIENKYQGFYEEAEKIKQLRPDCVLISSFDKNNKNLMPEQNILVLNHVIRAFEGLEYFLPNCGDMVRLALALRKTWQDIIELRGRKLWKQEDSFKKKKHSI